MQNGPPYVGQVCRTSAFPPRSLTAAHCLGADPSPNVTPRMRMGEKPAQCAASYESHDGSPATQNAAGGEVKAEVCPISHTKELGVSNTSPQPSALPSSWVSNAGMSGPSFSESRTIVPCPPVVKSVTVTWKPSRAGVVNQWMLTVSPECIASGWFALPLVSMALKAAVSWNTPGVPVWVSLKTGEQALYEPGTFFTTNPPCGVQFVTTALG